jgi:S1-C subfamily serine protease
VADHSVIIPPAEVSPESASTTTPNLLPYEFVKRLVIMSLIVGLVSGGFGSFIYIRYFASSIPTNKQQLVVQESSAVINAAKTVSPSVVSITTKTVQPGESILGLSSGNSTTQEGAGTGMVITSDGLILTNNHVITGGGTITVFTSDGKQYKGTVVATNSVQDYAFVRISAAGLTPVKLGDSSAVQVGQSVIAIGNALGQFNNTVTNGIISGKGRPVTASDGGSSSSQSENLQDLFQTDAAINPGNSGGPLVNLAGQVIGMNTAVAGNAQNIGFAIPINEVKSAIASVQTKGVIERPYLGVRYTPITPDVVASNNLSVSEGALVSGDSQNEAIVSGSPADKAGLKSGDIITKVGSQTIDSNHSLTSLIATYKPGDKVTLTIVRGGKTQTLSVTLGTVPVSS